MPCKQTPNNRPPAAWNPSIETPTNATPWEKKNSASRKKIKIGKVKKIGETHKKNNHPLHPRSHALRWNVFRPLCGHRSEKTWADIREESKPHFLTCSIINGAPLFSKPAIAKIIVAIVFMGCGASRLHSVALRGNEKKVKKIGETNKKNNRAV